MVLSVYYDKNGYSVLLLRSENIVVKRVPGKGPLSLTQIRVNDDSKNGKSAAKYDPLFGQSDGFRPHYLSSL